MKLTQHLMCIFTILAPFLVSCSSSGGTSGTGVRSYQGVVLDEKGEARSGVEVTLLESGESTKTDEKGLYRLSGSRDDEKASLEFALSEQSSTLEIASLTEEIVSATINVILDEQGQVEFGQGSLRDEDGDIEIEDDQITIKNENGNIVVDGEEVIIGNGSSTVTTSENGSTNITSPNGSVETENGNTTVTNGESGISVDPEGNVSIETPNGSVSLPSGATEK